MLNSFKSTFLLSPDTENAMGGEGEASNAAGVATAPAKLAADDNPNATESAFGGELDNSLSDGESAFGDETTDQSEGADPFSTTGNDTTAKAAPAAAASNKQTAEQQTRNTTLIDGVFGEGSAAAAAQKYGADFLTKMAEMAKERIAAGQGDAEGAADEGAAGETGEAAAATSEDESGEAAEPKPAAPKPGTKGESAGVSPFVLTDEAKEVLTDALGDKGFDSFVAPLVKHTQAQARLVQEQHKQIATMTKAVANMQARQNLQYEESVIDRQNDPLFGDSAKGYSEAQHKNRLALYANARGYFKGNPKGSVAAALNFGAEMVRSTAAGFVAKGAGGTAGTGSKAAVPSNRAGMVGSVSAGRATGIAPGGKMSNKEIAKSLDASLAAMRG